jgi:hypothetical protein
MLEKHWTFIRLCTAHTMILEKSSNEFDIRITVTYFGGENHVLLG